VVARLVAGRPHGIEHRQVGLRHHGEDLFRLAARDRRCGDGRRRADEEIPTSHRVALLVFGLACAGAPSTKGQFETCFKFEPSAFSQGSELGSRRVRCLAINTSQEHVMGRGILLWLLGVPIPVILILALLFR